MVVFKKRKWQTFLFLSFVCLILSCYIWIESHNWSWIFLSVPIFAFVFFQKNEILFIDNSMLVIDSGKIWKGKFSVPISDIKNCFKSIQKVQGDDVRCVSFKFSKKQDIINGPNILRYDNDLNILSFEEFIFRDNASYIVEEIMKEIHASNRK